MDLTREDEKIVNASVVKTLESIYDVLLPVITEVVVLVVEVYLSLSDLTYKQRMAALKIMSRLRMMYPFATKEELMEIIRDMAGRGELDEEPDNENKAVDIQSGERPAQGNSQ